MQQACDAAFDLTFSIASKPSLAKSALSLKDLRSIDKAN
jgi:hypothetical protein